MGLRDRLKRNVKRALGKEPAPKNTVAQALAPPLVAAPPRVAAPAPPAATPQPPPPAPPAPVVVALAPTPRPAAPPSEAAFVSDVATSDAPARNAHYHQRFETTDAAVAVRVFDGQLQTWLEFLAEPGEYVLDAAERAGFELPYSCRSGGCLACAAKLVEGVAQLGEQYVLEDEHLADGFFLLCCTTVSAASSFLGDQEDAIK